MYKTDCNPYTTCFYIKYSHYYKSICKIVHVRLIVKWGVLCITSTCNSYNLMSLINFYLSSCRSFDKHVLQCIQTC